ncbi:capsular biosynthesis protein CpsI [Coxiella-like endosymbiont of Rhipicephalus sanguineus]|uniref:NAD-dependent epimerase n=1 Tax=Coxiella-like endosymbiont of Rhipicephalus sanguineus TaxID=1955402 RepID=UPI00203DD928|nr:NAD-dependent epimerase [Coxiella-like endosymbiont of Rhipicephalus sanguineus]MBT8506272.1 capsular biosynthesis protein CpsI [Coxiella-like endosymbiont of Rhipicephalus sanguineus]
MQILVTGCAGFIGFHLTKRLLEQYEAVTGLDNLNSYYDVKLKEARLTELKNFPHFNFVKLDLADRPGISDLFQQQTFDRVVHLAAQAGVRYSITNPYAYVDANLVGFAHILEGCRYQSVKHLVFASSSSVYGANQKYPFSESDNVDHPIALYAASKKANELMAHSYAHLFHLPCTGLRFFTVYGPWGRPDMALFKFTRRLLADEPIDVYNQGNMLRDFTYIDDIIEGILFTLNREPKPDLTWTGNPAKSKAPYRIYNIGSNNPIPLLDFIAVLEKVLNKKAIKNFLPIQPGDVPQTYADISLFENDFCYRPKTPLLEGIKNFIDWYLEFYGIAVH